MITLNDNMYEIRSLTGYFKWNCTKTQPRYTYFLTRSNNSHNIIKYFTQYYCHHEILR